MIYVNRLFDWYARHSVKQCAGITVILILPASAPGIAFSLLFPSLAVVGTMICVVMGGISALPLAARLTP